MKATNLILAGIALMSAVAFGQAPQVVAETEKLDPQTSADL